MLELLALLADGRALQILPGGGILLGKRRSFEQVLIVMLSEECVSRAVVTVEVSLILAWSVEERSLQLEPLLLEELNFLFIDVLIIKHSQLLHARLHLRSESRILLEQLRPVITVLRGIHLSNNVVELGDLVTDLVADAWQEL